jgi:hypothetical protein
MKRIEIRDIKGGRAGCDVGKKSNRDIVFVMVLNPMSFARKQ